MKEAKAAADQARKAAREAGAEAAAAPEKAAGSAADAGATTGGDAGDGALPVRRRGDGWVLPRGLLSEVASGRGSGAA